jgi:hypothetical protein
MAERQGSNNILKSKNEIKVYYARAMDDISIVEIKKDDLEVSNLVQERGFSLNNPFEEYRDISQSYRTIIENNLRLLQSSNVLLANLSIPGYVYVGAIFEIVQAVNFGIPTIIFTGKTMLDKRIYLRYYTQYICETLEEAIACMHNSLNLKVSC